MSGKEDPRFKYVAKIVASQLSTATQQVTAAMVDKGSNVTTVNEFLAAGSDGVEPRMALLFFLQPREGSSEPTVFMTTGEQEGLTGKCCYCVRLSDPMQPLPSDVEMCLNFGTLSHSGGPMATLKALVNDLYKPLIKGNSFGHSKKMTADHRAALQDGADSLDRKSVV